MASKAALGLVFAVCLALPAAAADPDLGYRDFAKVGSFAEVRENLDEAITKRGFVIDYVGKFNAMLERTAQAAESVTEKGVKSPYRNAEYVQFCPSKLTHDAVSASPFAIANCPIAVYVYELGHEPGKIHVGYRLPVPSPSKLSRGINAQIEALLKSIAEDALN